MTSPIEPMQWLSMIASFVLVLVLLGGTLWLLRRMGGRSLRGGTGRLAITESLWLGPRQRLALVRVDGQDILIAVTQQSVTLLTALPGQAIAQAATATESGTDSSIHSGADAVAVHADPPQVQPDPAVSDRFRQLLRAWSPRASGGNDK